MYPFGDMGNTAKWPLEKAGVQKPARTEGHDPSATANLEKVDDGLELRELRGVEHHLPETGFVRFNNRRARRLLREKLGRRSPDSFVKIGADRAALFVIGRRAILALEPPF